ncbi:hypothetical protein DFJ73DRAFT_844804 [Zopfochytrium polystomum]|nr:hypothetical protein DFJ73DRAFT_844804 [Zopfochytrium polystomum]
MRLHCLPRFGSGIKKSRHKFPEGLFAATRLVFRFWSKPPVRSQESIDIFVARSDSPSGTVDRISCDAKGGDDCQLTAKPFACNNLLICAEEGDKFFKSDSQFGVGSTSKEGKKVQTKTDHPSEDLHRPTHRQSQRAKKADFNPMLAIRDSSCSCNLDCFDDDSSYNYDEDIIDRDYSDVLEKRLMLERFTDINLDSTIFGEGQNEINTDSPSTRDLVNFIQKLCSAQKSITQDPSYFEHVEAWEQQRKCSLCNLPGHNKRTCPQRT